MNVIISCSDQISLSFLEKAIREVEIVRKVDKLIFYSAPSKELKEFVNKYNEKHIIICLDGEDDKRKQEYINIGISEFYDEIPEHSNYTPKDIELTDSHVFANIKSFYSIELYLFLEYEDELDSIKLQLLYESDGSKKLTVYTCDQYLIIENMHYKYSSFHKYLLNLNILGIDGNYTYLNNKHDIKIRKKSKRPNIIEIPRKEIAVFAKKNEIT